MVLARLITTERGEIGLLKAFGYTHWQVAWHYTKLVIVIALIGSLVGWVLGGIFGRYQTGLYAELFRFPLLIYRPSPMAFAVAGGVSVATTLAGDSESRSFAGDSEGRSFGGDSEDRSLGGATGSFTCSLQPSCAGFVFHDPADRTLAYFDGASIRTSNDRCVL